VNLSGIDKFTYPLADMTSQQQTSYPTIYEVSLTDSKEDEWVRQLQRKAIEITTPIQPLPRPELPRDTGIRAASSALEPLRPEPIAAWDENSKAMFLTRTDVSKLNGILKQTNLQ
jgi:hypothetical protein